MDNFNHNPTSFTFYQVPLNLTKLPKRSFPISIITTNSQKSQKLGSKPAKIPPKLSDGFDYSSLESQRKLPCCSNRTNKTNKTNTSSVYSFCSPRSTKSTSNVSYRNYIGSYVEKTVGEKKKEESCDVNVSHNYTKPSKIPKNKLTKLTQQKYSGSPSKILKSLLSPREIHQNLAESRRKNDDILFEYIHKIKGNKLNKYKESSARVYKIKLNKSNKIHRIRKDLESNTNDLEFNTEKCNYFKRRNVSDLKDVESKKIYGSVLNKKIDDLKEEIKSLQSKISSLKNEISSSNLSSRELKASLEIQNAEMRKLKHENEKLSAENSNVFGALKLIIDKISDIKSVLRIESRVRERSNAVFQRWKSLLEKY